VTPLTQEAGAWLPAVGDWVHPHLAVYRDAAGLILVEVQADAVTALSPPLPSLVALADWAAATPVTLAGGLKLPAGSERVSSLLTEAAADLLGGLDIDGVIEGICPAERGDSLRVLRLSPVDRHTWCCLPAEVETVMYAAATAVGAAAAMSLVWTRVSVRDVVWLLTLPEGCPLRWPTRLHSQSALDTRA
jgi:hypothetical protein